MSVVWTAVDLASYENPSSDISPQFVHLRDGIYYVQPSMTPPTCTTSVVSTPPLKVVGGVKVQSQSAPILQSLLLEASTSEFVAPLPVRI